VAELHAAIAQPKTSLVLMFCSSRRNLDQLAEAAGAAFSCPVIGCTTAGEISNAGYQENSLVGVSLAADSFTIYSALIESVVDFGAVEAEQLAQSLLPSAQPAPGKQRFGLLLIDGMSLCEERVTAHLHQAFGQMQIVGGSAGDDLAFQATQVLAEGRFRNGAAVFCVVETDLSFRAFRTQHLVPTDRKLVITEADPSTRRVTEIDGMPAREAYAEALGLPVDQLCPALYSSHPVLLQIGGQSYVRSIQRAEPDGSLVFYCAIDNGLVLTLAECTDLADNLQTSLRRLEQDLGSIELIIGFDCILRRLEMRDRGELDAIERILAPYPFVGFSTFGEQFNGIHVNQTLTGIAFGGRR